MFSGLGILMAERCDVVEAGRRIGMFGRNEGQGWGSEGLMEGKCLSSMMMCGCGFLSSVKSLDSKSRLNSSKK